MEFPPVPPAGWLEAFQGQIQTAIAPVVNKVNALETTVGEVQGRLAILEKRQKKFEEDLNGGSTRGQHVPTYVDIKGFCEWEMWEE